jgi:hypothetical protein
MSTSLTNLELLVSISNLRATISDPQAFLETLEPKAQWLKLKALEEELRTMERRFVNHALLAAGLPVDPEEMSIPPRMVAPRGPAVKALQVPRLPSMQREPRAVANIEVHK